MDWITDRRALITIRALGLREGDEVRLNFPTGEVWDGLELRIIDQQRRLWEVETITPSIKKLTARHWDPNRPEEWDLVAWRRPNSKEKA